MAEGSQYTTPPLQPATTPTLHKEDQPPPAHKVDSSPPLVDLESTTTTTDKEMMPSPQQPAPGADENRSLAAMMEKESKSSPSSPPLEADAEKIKEDVATEAGKEKPPENYNEENRKIPETLISFKEESNLLADLSDVERKALQEFKQLVQDALNNRQLISSAPPPPPPNKEEDQDKQTSESDKSTEITKRQEQATAQQSQETAPEEEVVSIWGVPLLKDDRSDVILLKFLRARDFKVSDAFLMIKNTLQWRKDFGIDSLLDEDLGDDLDKVVFMHGYDREGHSVCYNVYGEFQNKILYHNTFSDEDKRLKFLRWRIQFLEKSIRKLDFRPGGVSTIFQVNDLKNSPGPGKRELRIATKQALHLLQDNYPEFVAKQVFINVPWWYLAFYTMISPFMTQRTKSKFVFAGPSKSAETLFKYISPEHVPIQYGGLSIDYCDCNPEFTIDDSVTEITVKPGTKQTVEIIIYEKCTIVWEIRVVGWDVSYGAEFVPEAKDRYTIVIQKPTKLSTTDEPVVSHKFKVDELGKVLLTVDNPTSKKKKLLYRFKVEPFCN